MKLFSLVPLMLLVILTRPSGPSFSVSEQPAGAFHARGYRILLPVGESHRGFPLLKPMPSDDPRCDTLRMLFANTFLKEMVVLNDYLQTRLISTGKKQEKEPLYLLLSGRMGGYPRMGFFLKTGEGVVDKTRVPYIDLADLDRNHRRLSSITQIFPHELGHQFLREVTGFDPNKAESWSPDVHYFSVVTDYYKAFDEGFAEAFENYSRMFEPDTNTRNAIGADISRLKKELPRRVSGFERDFTWPLRIGYYRMAMPVWFQQFENLKRTDWVDQNLARRGVEGHWAGSPESTIQYRNAGVMPGNGDFLNRAQALSNEGVISTFFTMLMRSDLRFRYPESRFFYPYVTDTTLMRSPDTTVSPMINQLLKTFIALEQGLSSNSGANSPLLAFTEAYLNLFPEEASVLKAVFDSATGHPYFSQAPPEIWLFNDDHLHHAWVMAPFGGAEIPWYTMNLNTCRAEDLVTFRGVSREDAVRIIAYRDSSGGFRSAGELARVPLSAKVSDLLISKQLDKGDMVTMEMTPEIGFSGILFGLLRRLALVTGVIFISLSLVQFILFHRHERKFSRILLFGAGIFLKTAMFVAAGLLVMIFPSHPMLLFTPFVGVIILINWWRSRKGRHRLAGMLFSTFMLAFIISYALI